VTCADCGASGVITYGRGLCANCQRKDDMRDRSAYFERVKRDNAELEARRAHPAGRRRLRVVHGRDWIQRPYEFLGRS
jgi:hypothetical protein